MFRLDIQGVKKSCEANFEGYAARPDFRPKDFGPNDPNLEAQERYMIERYTMTSKEIYHIAWCVCRWPDTHCPLQNICRYHFDV